MSLVEVALWSASWVQGAGKMAGKSLNVRVAASDTRRALRWDTIMALVRANAVVLTEYYGSVYAIIGVEIGEDEGFTVAHVTGYGSAGLYNFTVQVGAYYDVWVKRSTVPSRFAGLL